MLFAAVELGPSAPFVGVLIAALALAGVVASVAVRATATAADGQSPRGRARRVPVWCLVWGVTFLLWGSSSGRGGPAPGGGTTGYTRAGILRYLTVASHRPGVGSAWSHDFSFHGWRLAGTVALTVAASTAGAAAVRGGRMTAAAPGPAPERRGA